MCCIRVTAKTNVEELCISSSISSQKANASVKGTATNILPVFFLAYNIDVAVFYRFVTAD